MPRALSLCCRSTVGDTFPVGCAFSSACVFPQTFAQNPDSAHPVYSTECGVYTRNCGLDRVKMSWGHGACTARRGCRAAGIHCASSARRACVADAAPLCLSGSRPCPPDEYLYQVCVRNNCTLPPHALAMIRYHSFYPWHTGGAYAHLTAPEDEQSLAWVRRFNAHDLYSKSHAKQDVQALKPYYQSVIAKYFPQELRW